VGSAISNIDQERSLRLSVGDERLDDFVSSNLNVEAIVEWVNCRNKEVKRNRIRFIETLPVFVPLLVWNPEHPFATEIAEWIDAGDPLVENIASLMGDVPPDTIQFLVNKPLSMVSLEWIDEELELVFNLSCVPQDSRPQSKADWAVFAEYAHTLYPVPWDASGHFFRELCRLGYGLELAKKLGLLPYELMRELGWVSRYINFLTSWAKAVIDSDPIATSNVVPFTRNAMRYSRDDPGPVDAWVNGYFSRLSASVIFDQTLEWRRAFRGVVARAHSESNDPELVQWPALFRQPFIDNQVRVTSVTTIEEAMREGAALEPFDRRYIESCSLGDGYLVTLKDLHGNHISSAMISLYSNGGQVFLSNGAHHRPNGDYSHNQDDDVLNKALDWLRLPEQQSWLQALVKFHAARREAVREKLDALEVLNLKAASHVLEKVGVDFEGARSELSGLRR
jgi:hypothetical protein